MKKEILGVHVDDVSREYVLEKIRSLSKGDGFEYIVTPNVNHVLRYDQSKEFRSFYHDAVLTVCDSRVLKVISFFKRKKIQFVNPGSDVVAKLLNELNSVLDIEKPTVYVFGPTLEQIQVLKSRYANVVFSGSCPDFGFEKDQSKLDVIFRELLNDSSEYYLLCVGSPKQEFIAYSLKLMGKKSGVAICCGASIDFLTGKVTRAPLIFQKLGIEWLFRMLSEPNRLFKRYFIDFFLLIRLIFRG